jgi:hypothetical protein
MLDSVSPHDGYRIGFLLSDIESGKTPDEAAVTLRNKTAEIRELNEFLEGVLSAPPMVKQAAVLDILEHPGKTLATSLDSSSSMLKNLATFAGVTGAGLAGLSVLPVLGGMHAGRAIGSAAGSLTADVGTPELRDLTRIEEIDSYRQAADEIMRRINRAEKKRKRKQIPSARLMF